MMRTLTAHPQKKGMSNQDMWKMLEKVFRDYPRIDLLETHEDRYEATIKLKLKKEFT